ncbi:MAG: cytochrome b [Curvibacter sp.]|nr:MAG: cytochrome b [Curvibacter sp.]
MRSLTPRDRYGLPSLALHWFMAFLLVALVICVELHELFPKGDPLRAGLVAWHFRLGMAVFVLVWLRLVLRWVDRTPPITPAPPRWQTGLSHAVQGLLYLLMIGMPLLGWAVVSAKGRSVPFFWGIELPPLLAPDKALAHTLMEVHEAGATVGYLLVGLHTAAALAHHYLFRDNTLVRMLPWQRTGGR